MFYIGGKWGSLRQTPMWHQTRMAIGLNLTILRCSAAQDFRGDESIHNMRRKSMLKLCTDLNVKTKRSNNLRLNHAHLLRSLSRKWICWEVKMFDQVNNQLIPPVIPFKSLFSGIGSNLLSCRDFRSSKMVCCIKYTESSRNRGA